MNNVHMSSFDPKRQLEMPNLIPAEKNYLVLSAEGGSGIMNDKGGLQHFGEEDWELIKEGIHPDGFVIKEIEITLN